MPSFSRARADPDSFPYGSDAMGNHGRPLAIPLRTGELAPAAGSPSNRAARLVIYSWRQEARADDLEYLAERAGVAFIQLL